MYKGQKPKDSRKKPPRRGGRKKNPSVGAKVGIAAAVFATVSAIGGGIYFWRKKKSDAKALPGGGDGGGKKGGGKKGGGKKGGGKKETPTMAFPYSDAELPDLERDAVAQQMIPYSKDQSKKIKVSKADSITDAAFYDLYPNLDGKKIPAEADRGPGWDPYIESWIRMNKTVREAIKSWNVYVDTDFPDIDLPGWFD